MGLPSVLEMFQRLRHPVLLVEQGILCSCCELIFGGLASRGLPCAKANLGTQTFIQFHPGPTREGSEGTAPRSTPQLPSLGR